MAEQVTAETLFYKLRAGLLLDHGLVLDESEAAEILATIRAGCQAEREECAVLAETRYLSPPWAGHYHNAGVGIAEAIRARTAAQEPTK